MFETQSQFEDDTVEIDRLAIDVDEDAGDVPADAIGAQVIGHLRRMMEES